MFPADRLIEREECVVCPVRQRLPLGIPADLFVVEQARLDAAGQEQAHMQHLVSSKGVHLGHGPASALTSSAASFSGERPNASVKPRRRRRRPGYSSDLLVPAREQQMSVLPGPFAPIDMIQIAAIELDPFVRKPYATIVDGSRFPDSMDESGKDAPWHRNHEMETVLAAAFR